MLEDFELGDNFTSDFVCIKSNGELLGRLIMTACVDAYSFMCLGYSNGFEGEIKSLQKLMLNVVSNKVELCSKYGIGINKEDLDRDKPPHKLITDKGKEYIYLTTTYFRQKISHTKKV